MAEEDRLQTQRKTIGEQQDQRMTWMMAQVPPLPFTEAIDAKVYQDEYGIEAIADWEIRKQIELTGGT